MDKQALVWRHLAQGALDAGPKELTQQQVAAELGLPKSRVFYAIAPLRATGAVEVVGKRLVIRDVRKILMHWAVQRRLDKDVLLELHSDETPMATVAACPPRLSFTSFAGFVRRFEQQPAPFSVVRAYVRPDDAETRAELLRRFRPAQTPQDTNLVLHRIDAADRVLAALPHVVPVAQLYVDLWNEPDFFAVDFLRALDSRYHLA